MADEEAAVEAAPPEEKKGGKKKFIIIGAVLLLLVGGGAAGYFLFLSGPSESESETAAKEEKKAADAIPKDSLGVTFELDPFVVNLAGESSRYLKVVIVAQLSSPELAVEMENRSPQLKDSIITVLSSKTPEEILSVQGKYDLKMELIKRLNANISAGVVRDLFFTEFVVQ